MKKSVNKEEPRPQNIELNQIGQEPRKGYTIPTLDSFNKNYEDFHSAIKFDFKQ